MHDRTVESGVKPGWNRPSGPDRRVNQRVRSAWNYATIPCRSARYAAYRHREQQSNQHTWDHKPLQ